MSDMTSSSTSYSTGDGSYYDPIYETTSYSTETVADEPITSTPAAYEGNVFEATSTTTAPTYSYEPTNYAPEIDPWATVTETGSTSYNSTDWGYVSEVSGEYHDAYLAQTDMANVFYDLSTDASIAGDSLLAYELNQVSLDYQSGADADWSTSSQAWTDMDMTTTVTSYDVSYDTSSYDTSSYDAGY